MSELLGLLKDFYKLPVPDRKKVLLIIVDKYAGKNDLFTFMEDVSEKDPSSELRSLAREKHDFLEKKYRVQKPPENVVPPELTRGKDLEKITLLVKRELETGTKEKIIAALNVIISRKLFHFFPFLVSYIQKCKDSYVTATLIRVISFIASNDSKCDKTIAKKVFLVFLNSTASRVRANALDALGALGIVQEDIPILEKLLGDEDNRVKANAAHAIGGLDFSRIEGFIRRMVVSSKENERVSAYWLCYEFAGKGCLDLLWQALEKEENDELILKISVYILKCDEENTEKFIGWLNKTSRNILVTSILQNGVASLQDEAEKVLIEKVLRDSEAKILQPVPEETPARIPKSVEMFIEEFNAQQDIEIRNAALTAISIRSEQEIWDLIELATLDDEAKVRVCARKLLEKFENGEEFKGRPVYYEQELEKFENKIPEDTYFVEAVAVVPEIVPEAETVSEPAAEIELSEGIAMETEEEHKPEEKTRTTGEIDDLRNEIERKKNEIKEIQESLREIRVSLVKGLADSGRDLKEKIELIKELGYKDSEFLDAARNNNQNYIDKFIEGIVTIEEIRKQHPSFFEYIESGQVLDEGIRNVIEKSKDPLFSSSFKSELEMLFRDDSGLKEEFVNYVNEKKSQGYQVSSYRSKFDLPIFQIKNEYTKLKANILKLEKFALLIEHSEIRIFEDRIETIKSLLKDVNEVDNIAKLIEDSTQMVNGLRTNIIECVENWRSQGFVMSVFSGKLAGDIVKLNEIFQEYKAKIITIKDTVKSLDEIQTEENTTIIAGLKKEFFDLSNYDLNLKNAEELLRDSKYYSDLKDKKLKECIEKHKAMGFSVDRLNDVSGDDENMIKLVIREYLTDVNRIQNISRYSRQVCKDFRNKPDVEKLNSLLKKLFLMENLDSNFKEICELLLMNNIPLKDWDAEMEPGEEPVNREDAVGVQDAVADKAEQKADQDEQTEDESLDEIEAAPVTPVTNKIAQPRMVKVYATIALVFMLVIGSVVFMIYNHFFNPSSIVKQGIALYKKGQFAGALEKFKLAKQKDPALQDIDKYICGTLIEMSYIEPNTNKQIELLLEAHPFSDKGIYHNIFKETGGAAEPSPPEAEPQKRNLTGRRGSKGRGPDKSAPSSDVVNIDHLLAEKYYEETFTLDNDRQKFLNLKKAVQRNPASEKLIDAFCDFGINMINALPGKTPEERKTYRPQRQAILESLVQSAPNSHKVKLAEITSYNMDDEFQKTLSVAEQIYKNNKFDASLAPVVKDAVLKIGNAMSKEDEKIAFFTQNLKFDTKEKFIAVELKLLYKQKAANTTKIEDSLYFFKEVQKLFPGDKEVNGEIIDIYIESAKKAKLLEQRGLFLEKAREIDKEYPPLYEQFARYYQMLAENTEIADEKNKWTDLEKESLESFIKHKPDNQFAIKRLSMIYYEKSLATEDNDLKRTYLKEALKYDKNNPMVYYELGVTNTKLNLLIKAKEYFIEATKIKEDYTLAYRNLALICEKEKKFEESVRWWKQYIKLITDEETIKQVRDRIRTLLQMKND